MGDNTAYDLSDTLRYIYNANTRATEAKIDTRSEMEKLIDAEVDRLQGVDNTVYLTNGLEYQAKAWGKSVQVAMEASAAKVFGGQKWA